VSLLYAAGSCMLAIASAFHKNSTMHPYVVFNMFQIKEFLKTKRFSWLDLLGFITIAIGTGGIKPCVAPFGADQFNKGQEHLIEPYFSFFYFSINAGSLLSVNLSPLVAGLLI
jgi:dipeptide/tripeptide permease